MAEFWKSAPRFWCKQCSVYIRDTAFEKSQHEATAKHQGNLKRFLRDIHRENDRQQRESHKAKSEVERLRQTVSGPSAARDTGVPPWKRASPPPKQAEKPASLDERKKQMAQLADMGISIPEEFRGDMALAGDWQTVSQVIRAEGSETPDKAGLSVGVRKRKHEGGDEDDETRMFVSRGWGSRIREYPGAGAQDDKDLDALLDSTKDIKKSKPTASDTVAQEGPADSEASVKREEETKSPEPDLPLQPKEEEQSAADKPSIPPIKDEPEEPAPEVVFKKRKPKAMRK
ncbi:formin binding protein [Aspergillus sp. HF37]|nr:formin binding protein [Aspergillus sp. HF37]